MRPGAAGPSKPKKPKVWGENRRRMMTYLSLLAGGSTFNQLFGDLWETHRIHGTFVYVPYIYHEIQSNVGKYTTSPMDAIGYGVCHPIYNWFLGPPTVLPKAVAWYQKPQTSLSCHSSHSQERWPNWSRLSARAGGACHPPVAANLNPPKIADLKGAILYRTMVC